MLGSTLWGCFNTLQKPPIRKTSQLTDRDTLAVGFKTPSLANHPKQRGSRTWTMAHAMCQISKAGLVWRVGFAWFCFVWRSRKATQNPVGKGKEESGAPGDWRFSF